MKLGLSLKLILKEPYLCKRLADLLLEHGHEVHIVTGHTSSEAISLLEYKGINGTRVLSISEDLERRNIRLPDRADRAKRQYYWDKTKATYCREKGIDLHLEVETDTDRYAQEQQLIFFQSPVCIVESRDQLPILPKRKLKVGFDLHGVVDSRPEFFRIFMALLKNDGHEVHVVTGAKFEKEKAVLEELNVPYTHFFSITDHHVSIATPIEWDDKGNPHLDPLLWDMTKGEYATRAGLDLHFDDSDIYHRFCSCPYARFYTRDSHRIKKIHI